MLEGQGPSGILFRVQNCLSTGDVKCSFLCLQHQTNTLPSQTSLTSPALELYQSYMTHSKILACVNDHTAQNIISHGERKKKYFACVSTWFSEISSQPPTPFPSVPQPSGMAFQRVSGDFSKGRRYK